MAMKYLKPTIVGAALMLAAGCSSPEAPDLEPWTPETNNSTNNTTNNPTNNATNNDTNNNMPDMDPDVDMGPDMPPMCENPAVCLAKGDCCAGSVCDLENAKCLPGYDGIHGVTADKLVIGIVADQSGPTSAVGRGIVDGIQAYFSHYNETRGGVYGRELELKIYNDAGDPDKGLAAVEGALDDVDNREVFAFIGNQGDGLAQKTIEVLNSSKTVVFGPVTGGTSTRKSPPARYIFNFRPSYQDENFRLVDFMINQSPDLKFPPKNVLLFTEAEADGSLGELGVAAKAGVAGPLGLAPHNISEDGFEIVTHARNSTNVDDAVANVLDWLASGQRTEMPFPTGQSCTAVDDTSCQAPPGAMAECMDFGGGTFNCVFPNQIFALLVVTAQAKPSAEFAKKLRKEQDRIFAGEWGTMGFDQTQAVRLMSSHPLLGLGSAAGDEFAKILLSAGPSQYCTSQDFAPDSNMAQSQVVPWYKGLGTTVSRYREQLAKYDAGLDPGFDSLEGYLVARLFVEALSRAGDTLTDEVLVDAIESIQDYSVLQIGPNPIDFLDHQGSDEVYGTAIDQDCLHHEHGGSN